MEAIADYLDMIEDILDSGRSIPFSSKVSVDKERLMGIIGEIRLSLPAELTQAQRIVDDHERFVNDAKLKASHIIREAEMQANSLVSEHDIYKQAVEQANELIAETKRIAKDLRINSVNYADEVIGKTEAMLRDIKVGVETQYRKFEEHVNESLDVLYQNRQSLRSSK